MSAAMKMRHTKKKGKRSQKSDSISWRKAFKDDLEERGEIGVYLRGLRKREGFTQKELAKKLGKGVSQHHISEMENGKRTISPAMAKKIATVLHTDYRMFL